MRESNRKRILVVEDDFQALRLLRSTLVSVGFEVLFEVSASQAPARILKAQPDLVILDAAAGEIDGLRICKEVRGRFAGPILLLGGAEDTDGEIAGLEVGADAYLRKPLSETLLLAHVQCLLRRAQRVNGDGILEGTGAVELGVLRVDGSRREVTLRGRVVNMAPSEFDLLWELARKPGEVLSREELSQRLLGHSWNAEDRALDLRVTRLRRRLNDDARRPRWIHSVRGSGYRLVAPERA